MVSYLEDRAKYDRDKYHEYRRRNMIAAFGEDNLFCVHCGSVENLEFDHIDPELKSFNINSRKSLKKEDYVEELKKCQLLCQDCHIKKTDSEKEEFCHGTMYGFQKAHCQCEECQAAKKDFYIRRNAERRAKSESNGRGSRGPYGRPSNHGEYLHYKRGCRCVLCKKANAEQTQVYLKNKKQNKPPVADPQ